ncbi:hypothetical protein [Apibacter sp. HY039]|uniref:hypothetical protein n=1 Tax=Apibacter sp. HY039 TaxID=2501476 RepID=UPI000FEBC411|nr:hypothetical protein [Apibacter sp. HY039]
MKRTLLFLMFTIFLGINLNAQVGIGTDLPDESAQLEIYSRDRGVLLPRLQLAERNAITNPAEGLIIYNLNEKCLNIYKGSEWKSFCGDAELAKVSALDCTEAQTDFDFATKTIDYTQDPPVANGTPTVRAQRPLTGDNTIRLTIDVVSEGAITVTAVTSNGYNFSYYNPLIGVGSQTIDLIPSGSPKNEGTDSVTITINGEVQSCKPTITVGPNVDPKEFTVDCTTATVNGRYIKGQAVDGNNYITIKVTNTSSTESVNYHVYSSDAINGVSFDGSGTLEASQSKVIALLASGTPTDQGSFTFTINSNSTVETTSCTVPITFEKIYRKVNVLGLGGGAYQPGSASSAYAPRAILENSANFGIDVNSKILVNGINIVNGAYAQGTALQNFITNNSIDIVIIGYDYQPTDESITILSNLVKTSDKPIIHSQENGVVSVQNMLNSIFGTSNITVTGSSPTLVNPFTNVDNEILNGPFMDLRNATGATDIKYGANDVNNSYYVSNLPSTAEILAYNNGNTTVWGLKHASLPYVYIGDSGWMLGLVNNPSDTTYPSAMQPLGVPISKSYQGGTVYNSYLYANAVAWAIKYVTRNDN